MVGRTLTAFILCSLGTAASSLTGTPSPAHDESSQKAREVHFKATVEGMDCAGITAIADLKISFETAMKEVTAADMGVDPSTVKMTLGCGPDIARGSISPPSEGRRAALIKFHAKQKVIASHAEKKLAAIPAMSKVTTSTIGVAFELEEDEKVHADEKVALSVPTTGRSFLMGAVSLALAWILFFVIVVKLKGPKAREINASAPSNALLEQDLEKTTEKDDCGLQEFRHHAFEPIKGKELQEESSPVTSDFSPVKPPKIEKDAKDEVEEEKLSERLPEPETRSRVEVEKKKEDPRSRFGKCGPCGGNNRGASEPGQTPKR